MHPSGAGPREVSPPTQVMIDNSQMMKAVLQINDQKIKERRTWVSADIVQQARTRATKCVWPICKCPDQRAWVFIKRFMQETLQLPQAEFEKQWPPVRQEITKALRTKRAAAVQDIKRAFLGSGLALLC